MDKTPEENVKKETEQLDNKPKKREHPLGPKIRIKAHSLSSVDKRSQIFASINKDTIEFQQNKEVMVRKAFVEFLESATTIVHTLDDKGEPVALSEPLYAVSRLG